ncbi:MAG: hypothetical protein BAJALOKI2v1_750013 [Promethearchaeota archaeon]|nr:MAG: hypothetical protein BAJALOKI2v1_750013 [Candidatus Lokiarchaeota archaeon]
MAENNKNPRKCPYCGEVLEHPYWTHIQQEHPGEYASKKTWIKLFKDYRGIGMEVEQSINVISELFNADKNEIEWFLKESGTLK